jgi:hypothetical protein
MPSMPLVARFARLFLADALRRLAEDYSVRQFLDIGTGPPTADNTHQVAQQRSQLAGRGARQPADQRLRPSRGQRRRGPAAGSYALRPPGTRAVGLA